MTSLDRMLPPPDRTDTRRNGTNGMNGHGPLISPAGALARRGRGEDPGSNGLALRPVRAEPPAHVASRKQSSYLQHLPGVYLKNEFLGRFLLIFESILDPIDRQVAQIHSYFDPETAPREVLDWMARWFGLLMDDHLSEERRRALLDNSAELLAWRGTKRGLSMLLRLTLDVDPEITEPTLAEVMQDPPARAWRFTVRVTVPASEPLDDDYIRHLVDLNRPAATAATVVINRG